jgi:anaerobic ribonucleoside-triphosphate reductase activating protein
MVVAGLDRYDLVNTPIADGATFTIWFAGCTHKCPGCQNKALWDFNNGQNFTPQKLHDLIIKETQKTKIHTVTLLGGEPLQQNLNELHELCISLFKSNIDVWIYTGYDFDYAKSLLYPVLPFIHTIKCGRYIEELKAEEGTFPITTNQKVYSRAGGWKPITINEEDT